MSINAIEGSVSITSITATSSRVAARPPSSTPPPPAPAADTQISGPGQLFSRLQQLAEQDPAKFKAEAQNIADQIRGAAQQSSGKAAEFQNKLADRFEAAAKSGDLSSLQPPARDGSAGAQHVHPHHHHGGAGGGPIAAILSSALEDVNRELGSAPAAVAADAVQGDTPRLDTAQETATGGA